MILVQLSSGQGPIECCKAVSLALRAIDKQCADSGVRLNIIEAIPTNEAGCFKSLLLQLEAKPTQLAKQIASSWQGQMLWVCQSQYRPRHKRKNWFFSGQVYVIDEAETDSAIRFQTCRASGAGGQHVNTTDSAVRATHIASGLSVRVESERSQHANKRLAKVLLLQKLAAEKQQAIANQNQQRWQQHWQVERGNPVRTFTGEKFTPGNKTQ